MKRVLHVLSSLERSGMETMLLTSHREWLQQGYQSDIVATAPKIGPLAEDLRAAGYQIFHLPFRGRIPYFPEMGVHPPVLPGCADLDMRSCMCIQRLRHPFLCF